MKRKTVKRKVITRTLSFLLSLIIVFYAIPTVIFAEVGKAIGSIGNTDDSSLNSENAAYTQDVYEVVSLREENVKHFRLEDGTYAAAEYGYAIHYIDENGEYRDIDNSLSKASGGVYANGNSRIKFAKKITGNETLFTLHENNTKITFSLLGAKKGTKGSVTNYQDIEKTELQKMMYLEKISSEIIYKDILDGVDLEYIAHSNNIKENIIVKEKSDSYYYSFELKLNGLYALLSESGDIKIINQKSEEVQYTIPAPVVYDAEMKYAPEDASCYILEDAGNGKYTLSVSVSEEWMNDVGRVYPVTVDPAIISGGTDSLVLDTTVMSSAPTASYGNETTLAVINSSTGTAHSYWKALILPDIPASAYLTSATITMNTMYFSGNTVAVYEVLSKWDETLTWNQYAAASYPKGQLGDTVIDYNAMTSGAYTWDITPIVKRWYEGYNYGVAFKNVPGQNASTSLVSSENSNISKIPVLTVNYRDMKGVEDYWSYSSHSAGVAGSGSVNLATGQLTLAIPTLSTTDSLMPYTPTLVYNSSMAGKHYTNTYTETANATAYTPYGFKLNICETILQKSFTDTTGAIQTYYVYSDADGTEHGFYALYEGGGVFIDENGMQKILTLQSDGSIAITDDTKWVRTFTQKTTGAWYLTKIMDSVGNAIIFTFDSQYRPTHVSMKPYNLSQIDFLNIYYYSTGQLRMIYNSASKDAVVFRYGNANGSSLGTSYYYLNQIDYAKGNSSVTLSNWEDFAASASSKTNITVNASATYKYTPSGYLISAADNTALQSLSYTWTDNKLTLINHTAGSSNLSGQSVSYAYGNKYTDVTSSGNDEILNTEDDIVTRYAFDDVGRSKSVYSHSKNGSEIYGAAVGEYETGERIKNNLKEQTVLGGSRVNLLLNGGFEEGTFNHWTVSGAVSKIDYKSADGAYAAKFSPTAGSTASITQYVRLSKGKYTLSMPYFSQISEGVSAFVEIVSISGSGFSATEQISLNPNYANGIDNLFSTSFELSSNTDNLRITIKFVSDASVTSAPIIKVYSVMLENNVGSSDFSLVSYGGFDASGINSSGTQTPISGYWTAESSSAPVIAVSDLPFGNSAKVDANISERRYVKQRIYEIDAATLNYFDTDMSMFESNAKNEYIVSGFGYSESAVYSPNAFFGIRVDVIYYQGSNKSDVTVSYTFDFLPGCKGWQFTGGSFTTQLDSTETVNYRCVKAIDIYCEYSKEAEGYALFDNISVVSSNGTDIERYDYYEEGTSIGLLKAKKNLFYSEYYEYDENRNLSRIANNRGELTDYTYTSNNLVSSTIEYSFLYLTSKDYPIEEENHGSLITKTPKTKTTYTYNSYGLVTDIETYQVDAALNKLSGSKKLYNHYSYNTTSGSKIFGSLAGEWDGLDVDIRYYYDSTNGRLLATINTDENTGVCYSYNNKGNLVAVRPATYSSSSYNIVTSSASVVYSYNSNNLLTAIATNSTTYNFTYDVFGNTTSASAGGENIASYEYNQNNGKLKKVSYSNGFIVNYVYNDLELLSEVWYTVNEITTKAYEYEYTADGQVYKFTDNVNQKQTVYRYDTNNRLVSFAEYSEEDYYHELSSSLSYNDKGRLMGVHYKLNNSEDISDDVFGWYNTYTYLDDGKLNSASIVTVNSIGNESYSYDDYDRLAGKVTSLYKSGDSSQRFVNATSYTYAEYSDRTSSWIKTYTSTVNSGTPLTYTFTYDQNGNITKIVYSTGEEIRYVYDALGQLIREDNGIYNATHLYTYDTAGNIISRRECNLTAAGTTPTVKKTYTYTYEAYGWRDRLESYYGQSITYDSIGNPINYYNGSSYTFTWSGKEMVSATKLWYNFTFTYNDEGIRTSKTKDGVTTTYYLNGSQILAEEISGNLTIYVYGSDGSPIGMQYHDATYADGVFDVYWYEKNIFGDVVGVYNEAGTKILSYRYDSYGRSIVYNHTNNFSSTAYKNPFRYRGYYYDLDLELYYLNARYYDAYTGRFINADNVSYLGANGDLNSYNLYAYCSNNPIMHTDPSGNSIVGSLVLCTFLGGAFSFSFNILSQLRKGNENIDWGNAVNSAITGAGTSFSYAVGVACFGPAIAGASSISSGAIIGSFFASLGISALSGGSGYIVEKAINKDLDKLKLKNVIAHSVTVAIEGAYNFAVGGMVGCVGTIGKKGDMMSKEWVSKLILGKEFSMPIKYPLDKMRKEIWR